MVKKVLLLLFTIAICFSAELSWQAIDQKIYTVSTSYQKAKARELMGAYPQAVDAYTYALQESNNLLNNKGLKKEKIMEVIPYTIASAYRLAIANEKMINGRMVYLYEQIERYKNTDELLSSTMALISSLRIDNSIDIPSIDYSHLYYARALNNLGMCYTLSSGSLWKKYLVYMPSDIIMIMDSVNKDLAHYQYINQITTTSNYQTAISGIVDKINENSQTDITLKLSYYTESKAELKKALISRYENAILAYKNRVDNNKTLFQNFAVIKTYEEFEKSDHSKQFILEVKYLLELLKKY